LSFRPFTQYVIAYICLQHSIYYLCSTYSSFEKEKTAQFKRNHAR
jgi:hypothetical protein